MDSPPSTLPPDFVADILNIHEMIVQTAEEDIPEPGRFRETRDKVESAVSRIDQHAFGRHLFPTIEEKAAILIKELNDLHCFPDGNKRTSLVAMAFYLLYNARPFVNTETEAEMVRRIADAKTPVPFVEIVEWIRNNTKPLDVHGIANNPRFSRYRDIQFGLSFRHTDLGDKDRIAIEAHARHGKTGHLLSRFPALQWFADFARPGKKTRGQPIFQQVEPPPSPDLATGKTTKVRSKSKKRAKNKRKRKSRRK